MPTDRELASLILIGAGLLVIALVPSLRRNIGPAILNALRIAFTSGSLLTVFALFMLWCVAWVTVLSLIRAWNLGLLSDTLIIVFTVGFPLLFQAVQAKSGTEIWNRIGKETIAISAFLLFYINLEPFPLVVELWTQPVIAIIAASEVVARREEKNRRIAGCLRLLLGVAGLAIAVWSTVQFILGAPTRDWQQFVLQLALTIWLPAVMFPFFYFASFYAAAQAITRRLRRYRTPALRRVTLAAALGLHLRLKWARAFGHPYEMQLLRAKGFREALGLMRDFRDDIDRREELEAKRLANLEAFAGQVGADGSGAQLDRREFEGTKRALYFIATAQGLRYERLCNRYWDDLTDAVLQPVARYALPDDHGMVVETTADGEKWRAWRRMPSGWHLGIGGRDGERGYFLFTSQEPPTNWPGDPGWADAARDLALPEDWTRDDRASI